MKKGVVIFWSFWVFWACLRLASSLHKQRPDIGACLKQVVQGSGIIVEDPIIKDTGQIVVIRVHDLDASGVLCSDGSDDLNIRVKTKLYPRFKYGDEVSFSGKLDLPFNFKGSDGRVFDYEGLLAKDDIYYEIKSASITKSADPGSGFVGILYSIKRGFVANLDHVLGEPHAALAAGIIIGDKSALSPQLLEDFRIVGLIHIVILSGFSITIIVHSLRRMLSVFPRIWGIIIGAIGIILFCILVGGSATVVRACSMASLVLFADLVRRDYSALRALIFVALLMIIQKPLILLHDSSFQISFLATLGLILLASPIEKRLRWIPKKFGIRGTVAATFAAQIFVSPYILYLMGQISIISVVVNILVLPFIPLTMLIIFLTGATGFISIWVSQFFGWCVHLLLSYILFMVQSFARVPFAAINIPQFSGWFVVVFYVTFLVAYWWLSRDGHEEKSRALKRYDKN